jgi:hypothetical protein
MKNTRWLIPLLLLVIAACASMASRDRLDQFSQAAETFKWAVLDGDFRAAARFIDGDPGFQHSVDAGSYKNIKVVKYTASRVNVSDDRTRIEQDVDLEYFLLNRNILKTARTRQVWQYDQEQKAWTLKTKLPDFAP